MSRRLAQMLLLSSGVWLVSYEFWLLAFPRDHVWMFGRAGHLVVLGVAAGLCVLRGVVDREERIAWLMIGFGCAAWMIGETYFTAALWNLRSIPVPSWADAGYLAFPPLVFGGIGLLALKRVRGLPVSVWIDGLAASLAVASVSAAVVFGAVLDTVGGTPAGVATNLAYPVSDLLLLGLLVGVTGVSGWRLSRTWVLIGAGVALFCVADSIYLVQTANNTYTPGGPFDVGWWAGITLLAAAAWTRPGQNQSDRPASEVAILFPLGFGALALGVMAVGDLRSKPLTPLAVALAVGSLAAIGVRLYLTFRQNRRMLTDSRQHALTDSLTGLPNRRALMDDLEAALVSADPAHPVILAMFDLDGFKGYNDAFGHPAGDELLRRVSSRLATTVQQRGAAYRLGGDEFCVLLRPRGEAAKSSLDAASSALSEDGEGFSIGCSYGAVMLPKEATTLSEALSLSDRRMYAAKNRGRASAARQSADVLVRALIEHAPDLEEHLSDVADLAVATARRLGLEGEEVEIVARAAQLHDIGKVAIPNSILLKPGRLDDVEWSFVRRHPSIGERILAAAPSLAVVAPLVRASHERFDGAGYPDGLAGPHIPLGARIVAVCDAFDAMTSNRPYQTQRSREDAQRELRRCAGTQFDPVVVDAFCRIRSAASEPAPAERRGRADWAPVDAY
jgi:two-component system, cell cycle response regulator